MKGDPKELKLIILPGQVMNIFTRTDNGFMVTHVVHGGDGEVSFNQTVHAEDEDEPDTRASVATALQEACIEAFDAYTQSKRDAGIVFAVKNTGWSDDPEADD